MQAYALCKTIIHLEEYLTQYTNNQLPTLKSDSHLPVFKNDEESSFFFFSIWIFFSEHSCFTGQQGKREAISLAPLYHFRPVHRHLDVSPAITAESSPLHIASRWT